MHPASRGGGARKGTILILIASLSATRRTNSIARFLTLFESPAKPWTNSSTIRLTSSTQPFLPLLTPASLSSGAWTFSGTEKKKYRARYPINILSNKLLLCTLQFPPKGVRDKMQCYIAVEKSLQNDLWCGLPSSGLLRRVTVVVLCMSDIRIFAVRLHFFYSPSSINAPMIASLEDCRPRTQCNHR